MPGDLVASAFYLLARWDELRVAERDRFGRLPLAASAFGRIAGLELEDPPVEGYLDALRAALRIPAADALGRRPDPRHRPHPAAHGQGARRHRPPARAARRWPPPWPGPTRGTTSPTCSRATWRRGVRSDGLPDRPQRATLWTGRPRRAYERERAAMAAAVRAAGGEVGLHGVVRLVRGRGRAGRRAGRPARRGRAPVEGVRFHYLRFRYHESVRWLEARRGALRLQPGVQRGARVRRRHRPALPPLARGRGAPRAPDAAAAGGDGHDAPLAPRPRRGGGRRARPARCSSACARPAAGSPLLWHNTYLADDRAPGYGALWERPARRARAGAAPTSGPAGGPAAPRRPGASLAGRGWST